MLEVTNLRPRGGADSLRLSLLPGILVPVPDPGPLLQALKVACRKHMIRALPPDPSATMTALDFRSLHQTYAAWRGRVPSVRPRRVHVSRELLANPDRLSYREGLAAALREISLGADLRPRMSTAVRHAYAPWIPPALARRRPRTMHLDLLLADWGLHHLHLGIGPHPKICGFVARSDHVLFIAFRQDDAYLVDLVRHESDGANWAALAILEVVVRNWPEAGILVPASDFVLGLKGGNWSDADRRELRRGGVSTNMVEIDGRVWSAGGQGMTGAPTKVMNHCMGVAWCLSGYEPTEEQTRDDLTAVATTHGVPDKWRAIVHGDEFGFLSDGVFARRGSLIP